ncbi:MAG: hypothetical protein ACM31G_09700 [Flavobacteriales bacterium]
MVGVNSSVGIGVIAQRKPSIGVPIELDIAEDTPFYDLPKAVRSVLIIKDSVPQTPDDQYTLDNNNTRITFIPQLTNLNFVMIVPFY